MLDKRFSNVVYIIDTLAEKYGMLPTEVLTKATTLDIQIHTHSLAYQDRQRKAHNGESIADTVTDTEIAEVYKAWRGS